MWSRRVLWGSSALAAKNKHRSSSSLRCAAIILAVVGCLGFLVPLRLRVGTTSHGTASHAITGVTPSNPTTSGANDPGSYEGALLTPASLSPLLETLQNFNGDAVAAMMGNRCRVTHQRELVNKKKPSQPISDDIRFRQCYGHDGTFSPRHFLYFGNHWGRHFNQMTSLTAALVLSRLLNRTLIIPPLLLEQKRRHRLTDLYDVHALLQTGDDSGNPFCVLFEDEFAQLESKRMGNNPVVAAACVTMRGIKPHPQLPTGFQLKCEGDPLFIKFKKQLPLFLEIAGGAAQARFLTLPLVIYYAQALPEGLVRCPWKLIRPHPVVERAAKLLASSGTTYPSGEAQETTRLSVGVHLRSLEGSCESRQQQYNKADSEQPEGRNLAIVEQCRMSPTYLHGFAARALQRRSGATTTAADVTFVIADDGQQPDRVRKLMSQLATPQLGSTAGRATAVRIEDVWASKGGTDDVAPTLKLLRSLILTKSVRNGDATDTFAASDAFFRLQVDYWTLVGADVFVGNQVSTVSMNVCRCRRAQGRLCDNFV